MHVRERGLPFKAEARRAYVSAELRLAMADMRVEISVETWLLASALRAQLTVWTDSPVALSRRFAAFYL
jgi:hypothetical protein